MRRLAMLAILASCNVPVVHFIGGDDDGGLIDAEHVTPGDYVWVRSLSQMQTQTITAGASGIVTPGYLYTTANLNGTLLTSAGNADLMIAGFTEADGTNLYAARHGNVGGEFGLLATISADGVPIVSGVTEGDMLVDLGQGPVTGGGTPVEDGYIGAYANGAAEWVARIIGPGSDKFLASARGPSSTVYGAGWYEPMAMFNGTMLPSVGGRDLIVARFNTFTGVTDLVKTYGGVTRDEVGSSGMATIDTDLSSFVLAGFFDDTLTFGGTATAVTASHGGLDTWIAKLDPNGNGIWAVTYGGPGDDRDVSCALDANGDVYITGTFTTSISFGSIALTSVGGVDIFIAKLDGATGAPIWAISFGSTNDDNGGEITVDGAGHLAWAGIVSGALNGMPTLGGNDAYLAEFGTVDGSLIWQHLYSTAADDGAGGVVYGKATGDLFASISMGASYDFGMPIIGDPNPIAVLIRIAP